MNSPAFQRLLDLLVYPSEGITLDLTPEDRGNWTGGNVGVGQLRGSLRGISAAAYPTLDIARLTVDQVSTIYRIDYWNRIAGDALPPAVAVLVCDEAINAGVGAAARDLQLAVDAVPDGQIGPATLAAVARRANSLDDLLAELLGRRGFRYGMTSTFPTFGLGWMRRLGRAAMVAAHI